MDSMASLAVILQLPHRGRSCLEPSIIDWITLDQEIQRERKYKLEGPWTQAETEPTADRRRLVISTILGLSIFTTQALTPSIPATTNLAAALSLPIPEIATPVFRATF